MGGGMETNKNRWIEDWASARENLEHNFRWTRRNLALVGIFGVAVPILVFKGIVKEFVSVTRFDEAHNPLLMGAIHMQDDDAGRPHRKFWLS